MRTETIYVCLPDEATPVWAPVDAEHVHDYVYRVIDCGGEDEAVEFGKGTLVRCRRQTLSGDFGQLGECLVAYEYVG